ncbi:MAG: 30S ribosomal protein S17 [Lentisphaerae bacterium RIFOXYB12_FULL_65_16]|nr:MAG: 30S ribosomal protein S17 [Lentisphaerae bacterium RIFOXYA12_64_32]OGV90155.1 MAG: 30S ribosomal protein S17 [Lentisphaerae bacterium RIFOXYB12_FULL_65_16]
MTDETKSKRSLRKTRVGVVVGDRPNKTIVVRIDRRAPHPLYKKVVLSSKRYYAHDENNEAKTGDTVEIMETRPLSKLKRWRLLTILQRAAKA